MTDYDHTLIPQIVYERWATDEVKPQASAMRIEFEKEEMNKNTIAILPIGSGKSTAAVTAIFSRVDPKLNHPQAIFIVPDKESAIQIMDLFLKMRKHSPITWVLGLPPSKKDYTPLAKKPLVEAQVIIGTPVTIHKWIVAKKLDLDGVQMLLIDDVDHLLAQPGFKDEVVRIMEAIRISKRSPQCQVIMCSTISSDAVEAFVSKTKRVLSKNEYILLTGKTEVSFLDTVKKYQVNYEALNKIPAMIMSTPPHKNIIAISPIGSGKSAALVTAILYRVDPKLQHPQAICIVPTRELAIQIKDLLLKMGMHNYLTCVLGLPPSKKDYTPLAKKLPVEEQVIIGTPATIFKWIVAQKLALDGVGMLMIDDVDHLLAEPGFKDEVVRIMKAIAISKRSPQCQVIICSTVSSDAVEAFVSKTKRVLSKNEYISLTAKTEAPFSVNAKQYKVIVPDEHSKIDIIKNRILDLKAEVGQTIMYVHTKESARRLYEALEANRFKSRTLDAADTQEQRDKVFKEFGEKRFQVLISTEILDWVFDQSQVGLVVFCDLSIILGSSSEPDLEQYSRCIGRGQFGHTGAVIYLMCGDTDKMMMEKIEMHNNVTEVLWTSDEQFEDALKKAGL